MTTCGSLFHDLMTQLTDHPVMNSALDARSLDEQFFAHRAIGFFIGQAEKVSLGAARVFIIRPAPGWFDWSGDAVKLVCDHYGLTMLFNKTPLEIWGMRPEWVGLAHDAMLLPYPSPEAHRLRGRLCGIPSEDIDTAYHERDGHGVRCEPETLTRQEA